MIAAISFGGLAVQVSWLGLVVGGQPALSLHSSNEPGELSQWLCHDDSTINIISVIIIICCVALKPGNEDLRTVMDRLCKFIYTKDSTDRIRTRAILCHIYHHALHDRWYEARDLMLMSHLQDSVQHSDIPTQVQKLESLRSASAGSYNTSSVKKIPQKGHIVV